MKAELDELLSKRYPRIFANRNLPASETSMCWGFECDDGWFQLIDSLCGDISAHEEILLSFSQKDYSPVVCDQLKEKFGELRFYYSGGDDFIRELVDKAEAKSAKTCEICGDSGVFMKRGFWFKALCQAHGIEHKYVTVDSDL